MNSIFFIYSVGLNLFFQPISYASNEYVQSLSYPGMRLWGNLPFSMGYKMYLQKMQSLHGKLVDILSRIHDPHSAAQAQESVIAIGKEVQSYINEINVRKVFRKNSHFYDIRVLANLASTDQMKDVEDQFKTEYKRLRSINDPSINLLLSIVNMYFIDDFNWLQEELPNNQSRQEDIKGNDMIDCHHSIFYGFLSSDCDKDSFSISKSWNWLNHITISSFLCLTNDILLARNWTYLESSMGLDTDFKDYKFFTIIDPQEYEIGLIIPDENNKFILCVASNGFIEKKFDNRNEAKLSDNKPLVQLKLSNFLGSSKNDIQQRFKGGFFVSLRSVPSFVKAALSNPFKAYYIPPPEIGDLSPEDAPYVRPNVQDFMDYQIEGGVSLPFFTSMQDMALKYKFEDNSLVEYVILLFDNDNICKGFAVKKK